MTKTIHQSPKKLATNFLLIVSQVQLFLVVTTQTLVEANWMGLHTDITNKINDP